MASPRQKYPDSETEYVQSEANISLRNLARKWREPFGTIASRAKRHGWTDQREQYQAKLRTLIVEKSLDRKATSIAQIKDDLEASLVRATLLLNTGLRDRDFNALKCAKIGTETIQNLHGLLNDIYHINATGSNRPTPEQFAEALDTLARAPGTDAPIPRHTA